MVVLAVPKENDKFQIAKKAIRDGRLVLSELETEFCWGTFHIKKSLETLQRSGGRGPRLGDGYLTIF